MMMINKENNLWKMGFITQDIPISIDHEELVTVYCPFSYGFSGEIYFVPSSNIRQLSIPPSEAMKFIISGGVSTIDFHPKIK